MKILNAFSLNMLTVFPAQPLIEEISIDEARDMLGAGLESAIGHEDTATACSIQLGLNVPCNRITISLEKGEVAVIGQYRGPRLEEGTTILPHDAKVTWYRVTMN